MTTHMLFSPDRAENGSILIGGVPASELAASYGTPLVVIDVDTLDARIAAFLQTAQRLDIDVAYAGKALLVKALAVHLRDAGLSLDCCSLGELVTAEAASYPAERIYLHGCGKPTEELQAAVDGRVGRVVVDNFDELERLGAMSRNAAPVSVILRVNTAIEAHTHEFVRTGGDNTKFGFALSDMARACAFTAAEPGLLLLGIHAHIGSQIVDSMPFIANLEILMEIYASAHAQGYTTMRDIIVGGGFGVPMHPNEVADRLDPQAVLEDIAARAKNLSHDAGVPYPRIGIEPGRAFIGEAGTTLYRVSSVKQQGSRRFVIVDGGMSDNPRPALYGSYHHPMLASRDTDAASQTMTVCGRTCENDELVQAELPSNVRSGDIVAMRVTGAYTYSMASNYNRFPRPALVFAGKGDHRLVARRETAAELGRYDV
jgi:diaminopimelate decarboxylase